MALIERPYDLYLKDLADPRVEEWQFMKGPSTVVGIALVYLLLIYKILPAFMENRKPFSLKKIILVYNIFQIAACVIIIYGVLSSGWTTRYLWGCQPVDYSNDPQAMRMLGFVYYTFLLKMVELLETIFFVLRKKQNQVSPLHVYHHTSTFILAWVVCKFIGGGMNTFPIVLNSFIHILMYVYYLLSSFGPEWQKVLVPWKPRLTMAQMVQFVILVVHSLQILQPECSAPKTAFAIYIPNIVLIHHMFWNFYKKNYMKNEEKKQA